MATSGQNTPPQKFIKSGLIQSKLPSSYKKSRSNSLSADLDNEQNPSSDETTTTDLPEKLNVSDIRRMFENQKPSEGTQRNIHKRRPTEPTVQTVLSPSIQTNTSGFSYLSTESPNSIVTTKFIQNKVPTTTRTPFIRAPSFPNVRSQPPPPSSPTTDEKKNSLIHTVLRVSLNNIDTNGINSSIDEQDTSSSPLPDSNDSSIVSENDDNNKRESSVQKIRALFDEKKTHHVYQYKSQNRRSEPPEKVPTVSVTETSRQPPPRPPPRPEKYLKSQTCSWHSVPTLDTADSATGDSSLSSNQNLSRCNSSDASFSDEEQDYTAEKHNKLRKCIEEVYTTEKTYVHVLYVLSTKLSAEVRNTCEKDDNAVIVFNNTYKSLLGNIQQMYQFHHDHVLPEIEQYITGHRVGNMWTVLQKNLKIIEVLYKNYYVTYADTQGKLDELCKTHPLINEAMLKCQVHLGNLYPITQLNCPNQRLLRYILCMKTAIKYIDENSAEYKETQNIHDELDRIASRCEEELVISAAQLNELKERLDNKFECIKDHRKLLWHGPLKKESPRKHADIAQRYMILFSDCILVCSEESGRKLDIKRELSMRGITVDVVPGDRTSILSDNENNSTDLYPFRVNAVEKSYRFLTDKEADRGTWVKKIRQASDDYNKRITPIELRRSSIKLDEHQLGFRAPAWINDTDVTRCQNCNNRFPASTIIYSRRHHCRSCGRCVCGSCSTKKIPLDYCRNEGEVRVCDSCYTHFTSTLVSKNTSIWPKSTREVDETIIFGDFRTVNSGMIVWIALQEDYQLHVYGAKLDQAEEYSIKLPDLIELQIETDTRTFILRETTKSHTFSIDTNHQIFYEKNDVLNEKMKNFDTKLSFYTNLWSESLQLARSTTLPGWYIRKRDSADSGVSNVG